MIALAPLALATALVAAGGGDKDTRSWLIRADTIYTAAGKPIEGGWVNVRDGRVFGITGTAPDTGAQRLEAAAITPGMIDLSTRIDLGAIAVEQTTETAADLSIEDALDLYSPRWQRELKSGVTTALAAPPDRDVIGGLCVALKTGGDPTLEARLVKRDVALRGAIGSSPSAGNRPVFPGSTPDIYNRRPTTRMGVEWVWRKSFYDALLAREREDLRTPQTDVLERVLKGELPVVIGASATQDIRTAVFLKQEFQLPRVVIDGAAEAWKDPEMLVGSGASVILPPFDFDGRSGPDGAFHAFHTAALLHARGVPIAFTGSGADDVGRRLAVQPALAQRGGLSFDAALAAVTIHPARMIGIDDRVGSLEAGKDADLVLWSGKPFEPTSRVIAVLLGGALVVDQRAAH